MLVYLIYAICLPFCMIDRGLLVYRSAWSIMIIIMHCFIKRCSYKLTLLPLCVARNACPWPWSLNKLLESIFWVSSESASEVEEMMCQNKEFQRGNIKLRTTLVLILWQTVIFGSRRETFWGRDCDWDHILRYDKVLFDIRSYSFWFYYKLNCNMWYPQ